MSGYRGRPEVILRIFRVTLFEIWQELLWRRRVLHRISRPGDRRTAYSATAGAAPVPSHIAYFGGAVALGRAAVPYRAVRMAGVDAGVGKIRTTTIC
jgi:hypothetical protein